MDPLDYLHLLLGSTSGNWPMLCPFLEVEMVTTNVQIHQCHASQ